MSFWAPLQTLPVEQGCVCRLSGKCRHWWAAHLCDLRWRVENILTSMQVEKLLDKCAMQNLVFIMFSFRDLWQCSGEFWGKKAAHDKTLCESEWMSECLYSGGKTDPRIILDYKFYLSSASPSPCDWQRQRNVDLDNGADGEEIVRILWIWEIEKDRIAASSFSFLA